MTAIPHAALALTSALDRFETASSRTLEAVTGGEGDLGAAVADMAAAKTQAIAALAVVRFSNEMWEALVEIGQEPEDEVSGLRHSAHA